MRVLTTADLGALIRHHRKKLGMDQKTLAERAGVSRYWIIDIEGGKARAEVGLVLRTLRVLGLNLEITEEVTQRAQATRARAGKVNADQLIKAALERRR